MEEVSCKHGYMGRRVHVSRLIWGGGFLLAGLYGEVSCKQGYMGRRVHVSRVIWGGGFL